MVPDPTASREPDQDAPLKSSWAGEYSQRRPLEGNGSSYTFDLVHFRLLVGMPALAQGLCRLNLAIAFSDASVLCSSTLFKGLCPLDPCTPNGPNFSGSRVFFSRWVDMSGSQAFSLWRETIRWFTWEPGWKFGPPAPRYSEFLPSFSCPGLHPLPHEFHPGNAVGALDHGTRAPHGRCSSSAPPRSPPAPQPHAPPQEARAGGQFACGPSWQPARPHRRSPPARPGDPGTRSIDDRGAVTGAGLGTQERHLPRLPTALPASPL